MRPSIHCELVNGPFGDPAVYADIMFERRALLFDLGDIRELPPRKLLRVTHVFVSHTHMDHFSGFDHLLRLMLGREKTIALYGPAGFIDKVDTSCKLTPGMSYKTMRETSSLTSMRCMITEPCAMHVFVRSASSSPSCNPIFT